MAESQPKATSNVYTAMLLIALVTLIAGAALVYMRSSELFPDLGPFGFVS